MKTSLLPLLTILLITGNLTAVLSDTDPGDALVMHDLSSSITGMNWPSKSDPCNWDLVTCTDGRVTAIQLGNKSVAGTLPASLGNLTALTRLELQYNDLSGPLPPLNKLTALQSLLLHNNKFTKIPENFFSGLSGLQSVYLDNNPFDPWPIPRSLNECVSLVNFSAISTNVTGGVPDLFGALPSLTHLALSLNFLSGSIPNTFSGSSIRSLWLNSQKGPTMSGSIEVIGSMSGLEELWLQNNEFSGPLPDFTNLTNLYDLQLRDNQFTGIVPESLKSLKTLKRLTLSNNFLQGSVPEFKNPIKELDIDVKLESFCLNKVGDCDPRVNALLQIVKSWGYPLKFAMNWKGNDPCSGWVGITCGSDGNITVVNFRKMGLNGTVPEEFTLLPKVQTILLSGNNLTGVVPKILSSITSLKELDLSDNNLSGDIPAFGKNVVVKTAGNRNIGKDIVNPDPNSHTLQNGTGLGSDDNGHKSKPVSTGVIVGSIIAVVFGISVIVLLGLFAYKKKRKHNSFGRVQSPNGNNMIVHPRRSGSDPDALKITINGGGSTSSYNANIIEAGNMVIAIQVLRNVTNNFSEENILGRGGFGTVYKGELHDGTKIAVKRMESGVITSKGLNEFKSEIAVLTKVRHRNLVSLLGYCLDGNERLLVYEYMPQGTLSRHLFEWEKEGLSPLEWKQRLSIALDVARGVEYLHSLAHQSFIHRDLKPSNILLGDDMKAKVSDFGLVRLAPEGKGSIETRLAGTFGYLAPEYAVTGRVTTKADVYSFGVILMELITGRKALDETQPEESVHLVTWFRRMQLANKQEKTLKSIIDPTIKVEDEETLASISTVAELAGHCCAREPMQRPDMGHAVNVLASIAELWKPSDDRESEDVFGIDLDLTLPQALKKWQGMDGEAGSSSLGFDVENTYTSTGTRPPGFADSFTSVDGR